MFCKEKYKFSLQKKILGYNRIEGSLMKRIVIRIEQLLTENHRLCTISQHSTAQHSTAQHSISYNSDRNIFRDIPVLNQIQKAAEWLRHFSLWKTALEQILALSVTNLVTWAFLILNLPCYLEDSTATEFFLSF